MCIRDSLSLFLKWISMERELKQMENIRLQVVLFRSTSNNNNYTNGWSGCSYLGVGKVRLKFPTKHSDFTYRWIKNNIMIVNTVELEKSCKK